MTERASQDGTAHEALHRRREAVTMALYVSITLLAALTVSDSPHGSDFLDVLTVDHGSDLDALTIVWGTTVGLAIAHWFAFGLAEELVHATSRRAVSLDLAAQVIGAFAVATVATLAVVVFPNDLELPAARFGAAGCVGIIAFVQIRTSGGTWVRAIGVALIALLLAAGVATVKRSVGH